MQVSIKWLKDYVEIDEPAEKIADRLTMAGVPVERIVRADEGLEKVITGRIEKIAPHPDSDHLLVCQLNIGSAELTQIVTGASNVREGHIVPVATVGAVLPGGKKISKGKLRGIPSNGMMCSAGELAIDTEGLPDEQVNGIYILPPDTPIGVPAAQVLGLDDVVRIAAREEPKVDAQARVQSEGLENVVGHGTRVGDTRSANAGVGLSLGLARAHHVGASRHVDHAVRQGLV